MLTSTAAKNTVQDAEVVNEGLSLQTDTGRIARLGLWALGISFGGFLAWAAIAPLDEGVPTTGIVSIDTKRKPVQHLAGGTVKEVLVREGQLVEAGQPLIRLSDTSLRADWQQLRQQYFGLRAAEGRLVAEQLGSPTISFSADLLQAASEDPEINRHAAVQKQLIASRRAAVGAAVGSIRESIRGMEAQVEATQRMAVEREQQRSIVN